MFASIKDGLRAAGKHPKLVLLIWAWYGLLALIPTLPLWSWWNASLGASPEAASALRRFSLGLFWDVSKYDTAGVLGLLVTATMAVMFVAFVSSAFMFGGTLEVLASDGDARSFMHRFFRGGGHFYWRFIRLALVAGVCLLLAVGALAAAMGAMTRPLTDSEWEPAGYLVGLGNVLVLALVGAFFLLALDYARIRVARDDGRSAFKAYFAALGFVLRHLLTAYGIAIPVVAMLAGLMVCDLAYETIAPAASTWGAIAVLFVIQQAVVLGRVFLRIGLVGAERHYDLAARPMPVPVPAEAFVPAGTLESPTAEEPLPADPAAPALDETRPAEGPPA